MTINYKGASIEASSQMTLGNVAITEWPLLTSDVDVIHTNIMLNAFRIAVNGGLSRLNMVDGFIDEFEDESGVNTAESQNESYDSSGDFYHNPYATEDGGHSVTNPSGNNHSFIDRSWQIDNSKTVSKMSLYSDRSGSFKVKIVLRNSASDYDIVVDESITHNGTGWEEVTLASPFAVPASGTYYAGAYMPTGNNSVSTATVARTYFATTDATGTGINPTSEANGQLYLLRVHYQADDISLLSNPVTADSEPDEAHLIVFEENVDTLSVNTDLKGWATRDPGRTVTTDSATDDKLDLTAHGFSNGNRVTVNSTSTLPAGLSAGTLYFIVNATTNDFELSLTSGGSAVDITDDGSGTHKVIQWDQVTLADEGNYETDKRVLSGTKDISGQPAGVDMKFLITSENNKAFKLHGAALEWR